MNIGRMKDPTMKVGLKRKIEVTTMKVVCD